jgi:predicted nucleotidyltransferase
MKDIPKRINEVLDTYFELLESKLPNLVEAYYLYGSVSLGAFKDGFSDIDFIAVIKRNATVTDVDTLKEIHKDMQRKFSDTILDGFYVMKEDLESLKRNEISSLRINDGKFQGFSKFDKNSIDAYQLKKYGITVKGQRIEDVNFKVNWDILISNMHDNLNTYWLNWVNDCKRFPSIRYIGLLFSLGMIEWGVLGVSRLFYTFKEKDITSKMGAGEYALRKVNQRWHKIIYESMRLRKGNKKSYYKSILERRKDAIG